MVPIKLLILSLMVLAVPSLGSTSEIQTEEQLTPAIVLETTSTSSIKILVEKLAVEYNVDKEVAVHIAEKESQFVATARGDQEVLPNGNGMCSNKKSPLYGKPANARGIYQITECWWPDVSDEQADDPEWAARWAMERLKEGKCSMWSTCPLN